MSGWKRLHGRVKSTPAQRPWESSLHLTPVSLIPSSAGFFYERRKPLSSDEVPLLAAGSAMQIPGSAAEWEAEMPAAAVLAVAP